MHVAPVGEDGAKHVICAAGLPVEARVGVVARGGELRLERVGEGLGAVERHPEAVVELAEICVGDDVADIDAHVERPGPELQSGEDVAVAYISAARHRRAPG